MKTFLVILALTAAFFLLLSASPNMPGGDDGYRHIKFANLIATNWQDVAQNSWHVAYLWPQPVDIWFLFHLLAAPLTLVFSLLVALKVYAAILFGGIVATFLWLLDALKLRYRLIWLGFLLCGSVTFIFRLSLGRALSLSIVLLLLTILAILKDKKLWVLLLSAAFALAYSAFFFILLVPFLWLAVSRNRSALELFLASLAGVGLGVLINPFFPANLPFALTLAASPVWAQRAGIALGREIYPTGITGIFYMALTLCLWVFAVVLFVRTKQYRTSGRPILFFFSYTIVLFTLTMSAQRFAEYFLPFATLFTALVFEPYIYKIPWKEVQQRFFKEKMIYLPGLIAGLGFLVVLSSNVFMNYEQVITSPSSQEFEGVSKFLLSDAQPGALIFDTQWDHYPRLFFWNSRDTYVIGVDPSYLYLMDKEKYWLWRHIADDDPLTCASRYCTAAAGATREIASIIRDKFLSSYIIVEKKRNLYLTRRLLHEPGVRRLYADADVVLFEILSP